MQAHDARKTVFKLLALAILAAGSAQAGQASYLGVGATVVRSLRLEASTAAASARGQAIRSIRLANGTFYVVGLDVGVNGASAPGALGLSVREDGAQVRYHGGQDGNWGRKNYGVTVPSQQQGTLQLQPREGTGEVGIFVPSHAAAQNVSLVVTVMADGQNASPAAAWVGHGAAAQQQMLASR